MPRKAKMLTMGELKALENKTGRHAVGDGLYLEVRPGSKLWMFRYSFHGKRRQMSVGSYPQVTLTDARRIAGRYLVTIREGKDPLDIKATRREESRRRDAIETFENCAEMWF
jgi:hypothetical protein